MVGALEIVNGASEIFSIMKIHFFLNQKGFLVYGIIG